MLRFVALVSAFAAIVAPAAEQAIPTTGVQNGFLTEEEAQAKFDAMLGVADEVAVSPIYGAGEISDPVLVLSDPRAIHELSHTFRFSIPIERRIEDGEEVLTGRSFLCGCYGQFQITLSKEKRQLMSLRIFHGKSVFCYDLVIDSQIAVDPSTLAPFYQRLLALAAEARKRRANKPVETTSGTRTGIREIAFGFTLAVSASHG